MKKNVASQSIGVQMITAADGTAFTGATTVYITGDAGTQAIGSVGSGACTHEGNGFHTYAPAQAETNYDHIAFTFIGTGAIPVTVQMFTDFPQTGDAFDRLGAPAGASVSADLVVIDNFVDDIETRLTAARAGYLDNLSAGAAALASVCTEARLAEMDAANLPATTDAILVDTAEIGTAGAGLTALASAADLATAVSYIDTEVAAIYNIVAHATYGNAALRTRGDAAWATATGFSTHAVADVWAVGTRALTDKAGFSLAADQTVNATKINGSAAAAAQLALSAATIVSGSAITGTLSTTQMTTDLTEATDDHYNGRVLIWTSGVLINQATAITDYTGVSKMLTYTATTEVPANGDTFVIV